MLEVSLRNMRLMKRQENDVLLQPLLNTYLVKNLKMTYLKCSTSAATREKQS